MTAAIEIVDVGMATTLQDHGRPGYAHLGVPTSGVVDPALAGVVNRLVGNPEHATVIETCGGLTVRAVTHVLVATTAESSPRSLLPGETVALAVGGAGRLWQYLAVRGGVVVEPVLGSSSHDTLSGLGPALLTPGGRLHIGPEPGEPIVADVAPLPAVADIVRLTPGPRSDWFAADWKDVLSETTWTITSTSRVGVRLSGGTLVRKIGDELPSEGLVRGALQVPPDGDPVMMLADHPTTGGYPVIAVVHPDDVAGLAQHAAGRSIRFRFAIEP